MKPKITYSSAGRGTLTAYQSLYRGREPPDQCMHSSLSWISALQIQGGHKDCCRFLRSLCVFLPTTLPVLQPKRTGAWALCMTRLGNVHGGLLSMEMPPGGWAGRGHANTQWPALGSWGIEIVIFLGKTLEIIKIYLTRKVQPGELKCQATSWWQNHKQGKSLPWVFGTLAAFDSRGGAGRWQWGGPPPSPCAHAWGSHRSCGLSLSGGFSMQLRHLTKDLWTLGRITISEPQCSQQQDGN